VDLWATWCALFVKIYQFSLWIIKYFLLMVISELYGRSNIRKAKKISNPGCFATSTQLLIAPLLEHLNKDSWPTIFGISGYSGAGTKAGSVPRVEPGSLHGGVRSYSLTDHIHEREAGHHLSSLSPFSTPIKVAFTPVVAPWFSGILSTASIPLKSKLTAADVHALFQQKYGGERLIRIQKDVPDLKDVEGKHDFVVGYCQVSSAGDRVVVVVSCVKPS
jgi:N-acetyl-gamma-glutamyl-phosphate reductase/acetylglutamate kinase